MSPNLNGGVSQCGACSLVFKSVTAFDEHRAGKPGVSRRCLTVTELRAAGLEPNEHGQWRKPAQGCNYFHQRSQDSVNEKDSHVST